MLPCQFGKGTRPWAELSARAQPRLGEGRSESVPASSRDLFDQLKCPAKGSLGQSPLTAGDVKTQHREAGGEGKKGTRG